MNVAKNSQTSDAVRPVNPMAASRKAAAQWLWPLLGVVAVVGGMVLGYALFG